MVLISNCHDVQGRVISTVWIRTTACHIVILLQTNVLSPSNHLIYFWVSFRKLVVEFHANPLFPYCLSWILYFYNEFPHHQFITLYSHYLFELASFITHSLRPRVYILMKTLEVLAGFTFCVFFIIVLLSSLTHFLPVFSSFSFLFIISSLSSFVF